MPPLARAIAYTPQPFLASVISTIEAGLAEAFPLATATEGEEEQQVQQEQEEQEQRTRWACCDVGCGSGRDAVWLAKRGLWSVRAVDRLPKCLARVCQLAERHGVRGRVACEEAVIKAGAAVSSRPYPLSASVGEESGHFLGRFDQGQYHLVVVVRFLEREFFGTLREMVRPGGGYLLFVSFLDRSGDGIVYESPKDPRRLLQPGELAKVFGEGAEGLGGFDVVRDEVCPLPDGRFVSAVLTRRR